MKELVGHRLEAIDRKNPTLCCVATIENYRVVRDNDYEILIHFDGWGTGYDYWTTIDNMDLFPAGYMAYITANNIQVRYHFNKPKGVYLI